ncbi:MAG: lamin tail domain-containing protein [Patescibacteria group bacterium]
MRKEKNQIYYIIQVIVRSTISIMAILCVAKVPVLGIKATVNTPSQTQPQITPSQSPSIALSPNPTSSTSTPSPTPTVNYHHLRLSEIMACPNSGQGEWIEIENTVQQSISLDGLALRDSSAVIFSFVNQEINNPFMSFDINNKLNNTGDSVYLILNNGSNQVIDQMSYTSCTAGFSWNRSQENWSESPITSRNSSNIWPTPTPSFTPTATPTPSNSATPTPSVSATATPTLTPTPLALTERTNKPTHSNLDGTKNSKLSERGEDFDLPHSYLDSIQISTSQINQLRPFLAISPNTSATEHLDATGVNHRITNQVQQLLTQQKWALLNAIMGGVLLSVWGSYHLYVDYQNSPAIS